jgi:peptide deformylase
VNKHFNTVTVSLDQLDLQSSVLRRPAAPLNFDEWSEEQLQETVRGMLWLQYHSFGVGIAAPQVGLSLQMAVIGRWREDPLVLINPTITWRSDEMLSDEEGCLSFPGYIASLDRPKSVTVAYTDVHGRSCELTADGLLARIIQHEVDHLHGTLYVDRLPDRSILAPFDPDSLADLAMMKLYAGRSAAAATE